VEVSVQFGVFFFGTVDMPDAGYDGPPSERRDYGPAVVNRVFDDLVVYAKEAEAAGFEQMWTAEHHFHNHGFEVVPNVVLLNAVLAQHTKTLKLGALCHVLTTWHPIRFAEDYAMADVMSGGRMLCGLGRGTEERESAPFGVNVGYRDAIDAHNREVFEEQVKIFKLATENHQFSFAGKHYRFPPDGLTFRDEPVTTLPLVPRPLNTPVRVYQAIFSTETIHYAARERHVAVYWGLPTEALLERWKLYASLVSEHHGATLRKGEDRLLVINCILGDTREQAFALARPGHDEIRKLIWPNTVRKNPALGRKAAPAWEESVETGQWHVGTAAEVREKLLALHAETGFEELTIFPHVPGMTRADVVDQLARFSRDVMPALREAGVRVRETVATA
jgi:alkanesulfonate monooxygenase SsuD/methylene tetrahydromethanopterin reductase-like flavin-dependent oxidoreductase (luciferase family)